MMTTLLIPILTVGALALLLGAVLGFSAKQFHVETDAKIEQILHMLPGANCGACGYPGCAVFAEKAAKGETAYNACPAAGAEAMKQIGEVLGVDATPANRRTAYVKCGGTNDNTRRNYIYDGPESCVAASQLATSGNKSCMYSCIGLASCLHVCPFSAIKMENGVAVIDKNKCTACGKCVDACPKNLIEIAPDRKNIRVLCASKDKGKLVRENCRAGCLGCNICVKACEPGAITLTDNIPYIDYEKCTLCKTCVNKCPGKVIKIIE